MNTGLQSLRFLRIAFVAGMLLWSRSLLTAQMIATDSPTDVAIVSNGWFVLNDTLTGQQVVTRRGNFHLDENGYLVSAEGMRLQGYCDVGLSVTGDLQVNGPDDFP
jgi:flagellar hook protein FlgE